MVPRILIFVLVALAAASAVHAAALPENHYFTITEGPQYYKRACSARNCIRSGHRALARVWKLLQRGHAPNRLLLTLSFSSECFSFFSVRVQIDMSVLAKLRV